jgi:predicted TIM-barrel fold metal-dependent hydrolase
MSSRTFNTLRADIDAMPIVDAHEHLIEQSDSLARDVDLFDLFDRTYVKADFVSAGMAEEDWVRAEFDPEEGWRRIRPYLNKVRNTAYYRSLIGAFRDLYDFTDDGLNDSNWRDLSEKIHAANKRKDWYRYVLKDKAHIEVCLLHRTGTGAFETDREFCLPVLLVEPLLYGYAELVMAENRMRRRVLQFGRRSLEIEYGVRVSSFEDYLGLVETIFEEAVARGAAAAKCPVAYRRILRFDAVGRSEAQRIFDKTDSEVTPTEAKAFQDYMMHVVVQSTIDHGLPLQFHTGMQSGFGNVLSNSNPLHLTNLISQYPEARFVLFHGSYPYVGELSVLAKTYPNVYLDFSWLPLISPEVAQRSLTEWLDTVPASKLEWGGDCAHVESIYGHLLQFRDVLARVLTERVERGQTDLEGALTVARRILWDNPWELYGLEQRRGARTLEGPDGVSIGDRHD